MASDSIGLILAFGLWLAIMNAYIVSISPQSSAPQEFQLQIKLDVRGVVK